MRRLVTAGLLYLTGIAVVLVIKPQYMFRDDGRWKEFGIGRDTRNFTYIPFWLFAIIWAMLSYIFIVMMETPVASSSRQMNQYPEPPRSNRSNNRNRAPELAPGYYMLNEGASGRNGVPRYVYIGPEEPLDT